MKGRIIEIDVLRGTAILAMIAIHATSYFLSDPLAHFVWNLLQFAVVTFVFCSAYLTLTQRPPNSIREVFIYFKKRAIRLLRPYYIYLVFLIPLMGLYEPQSLSPPSLFRAITLTTAENDITWLILLFVMFAFISPFLAYAARLHKNIFWAVAAGSFVSTLIFLFVKPAINFKLIMFAPWSFVAVCALYFAGHEDRRGFLWKLTLGAFLNFAVAGAFLILRGGSLVHLDNKYPPNLYHLSYGLMWIGLLWGVSAKLSQRLPHLIRFLSFLSRYSYAIYFIHFILLYIFVHFLRGWTLAHGWGALFIILLVLSCSIQLLFLRFLPKALHLN